MPKFVVIQDDVVLATCDTLDAAKLAVEELKKRQEIKLMLNKRLAKRFLKKNIPFNTSAFVIANVVSGGDQI